MINQEKTICTSLEKYVPLYGEDEHLQSILHNTHTQRTPRPGSEPSTSLSRNTVPSSRHLVHPPAATPEPHLPIFPQTEHSTRDVIRIFTPSSTTTPYNSHTKTSHHHNSKHMYLSPNVHPYSTAPSTRRYPPGPFKSTLPPPPGPPLRHTNTISTPLSQSRAPLTPKTYISKQNKPPAYFHNTAASAAAEQVAQPLLMPLPKTPAASPPRTPAAPDRVSRRAESRPGRRLWAPQDCEGGDVLVLRLAGFLGRARALGGRVWGSGWSGAAIGI